MKVRLLLAVICIFTLPMWFSTASNKVTTPSAMVAFAGHINPNGAWCECGSSQDCICDVGETRRNSPVSNKPSTANVPTGFDPGTSVLLITLVLLLGLRMRY